MKKENIYGQPGGKPAGPEAKPQAPTTQFDNTAQVEQQEKAVQDQIKINDEYFKGVEQHLQAELKLHQITQTQETTQLIAAINAREDADLAALNKEESAQGLSLAQRQKIEDEKTALILKAINERAQAEQKSAEAIQKSWENTLKPLQSAWDSQLKGLLSGTETFGQAMQNIFSTMVLDIIKKLETIVIEQVIIKGLMTAIGGPLGFVMPAAAGGEYEVEGTQPYLLHQGETVLPPAASETFRNMAEGGGGGMPTGGSGAGGDVHLHMIDATGVQALLTRYGTQFARSAFQMAARNPSIAGG